MRFFFTAAVFICLLAGCKIPTAKEAGIRYRTTPSEDIRSDYLWKEIGTAKELINQREKIVVVSGGDNPISLNAWENFKVRFPWTKNIDRNLLFQKTVFLRSPDAPKDCQAADCIITRAYKGFTWVEMAQPVAVDYIPSKTNFLNPEPGFLVIKTIKKCQLVYFDHVIFRLKDGKGNEYAMHATETKAPQLDVQLPEGWILERDSLEKPLIITPFGSEGECFFNIMGDHLGQGYHQYKYAGEYYPE